MKKTAQALEIAATGKLRIHRNLSYETYFSGYSRAIDGHVVLATYSFNAHAFNALERLMPFSTLYIAKAKEDDAIRFVQRFPLYVVYLVPELHVKACWFEKSRRMLIGSENFYSGTPDYEELSCEFEVTESSTKEVLNLAFDFDTREYLRVKYSASDIRIYDQGNHHGVSGKAYLPCHRETKYWNRISADDDIRDVSPHYIYCILEYHVLEEVSYLAFDRHYQFCGELSADAFKFLSTRFRVQRQDHSFLDAGRELQPASPLKDHFAMFHPIARDFTAECAYYVKYDI